MLKLTGEQKEKLAVHYEAFLRQKLARGDFLAVFERLHKKHLADAVSAVIKKVLEATDPTKDEEFMDRVGYQALKIREVA